MRKGHCLDEDEGESLASHVTTGETKRRDDACTREANARPDRRDALLGDESVLIILGVTALATYWAWIFSIFHANTLCPFSDALVERYLMLCVAAAGGSAISMIAFTLLGRTLQRIIDATWFSGALVVLSIPLGIPALLEQAGIALGPLQVVVPWVIGALSSSFIFLKTGPFFVWLERGKLMRSIALAFLFASLIYLLAIFLNPVASICTTMALPALSTVCSHAVNRRIMPGRPQSPDQSSRAYLASVSGRLREFAPTIPRTVLYTLVFGVTSYAVLRLAIASGHIAMIGIAILVSSIIFSIYAFSKNAGIDSGRYRTLLLPLIAIAILPYPYVPDLSKIFFLALIIFGFTCFDAITWGDLADEIRDRQLPVYPSFATPTVGNFAGIFIGWAAGAALYAALGADGFDAGFAIFSIVVVIALVLLLVWDLIRAEKEETATSHSDAFLDKWQGACDKIAASGELTNQEKNVYLMLARGRSQHYIAEQLFISPHTVKTHAYHIYKKIGVHSQQELIDMVEARL